MGVVERRVDGTGGSQRLVQRHPLGQPVQQTPDPRQAEDHVEGPAKRVMIRNPPHADLFAPVFAVAQQGFDAAVTFVLMFAQNQTGK